MPGFTTHYLFGIDAYRRIEYDSAKANLRKNHAAYCLGLQGPDIFFYYIPSHIMHRHNLGELAQDTKTGLFFKNLMDSRLLFAGDAKKEAIADAYICGFMGHYTLDCICHPFVYAMTKYDPDQQRKHTEYFGKHSCLETELDKEMLWRKRRLYPSQFKQEGTIILSAVQKYVISRMLSYAYVNTYKGIFVRTSMIRRSFLWLNNGLKLLNDPSGRKKVLVRLFEKYFIGQAFISPMMASDSIRFIEDPINYSKRTWTHPWTKETFDSTFIDLYDKAGKLYDFRLRNYYRMVRRGYKQNDKEAFLELYGNRSFLSGLTQGD